jgi:hypothetical protein
MYRHSERGISKFWTLVTAAFFAALSWVLSHAGFKGDTLQEQTTGITASKSVAYASGLHDIITRMILGGTPVNMISFNNPTTGKESEIFDPQGGQAAEEYPSASMGHVKGGPMGETPSVWGYKDLTDPLLGYYIKNVGSNDAVFGRDMFAYLHDVSQVACEQINRGLNIEGIPGQDDAVDYALEGGKGAPAYFIGKNVLLAASGKSYACIENVTGSGVYDYYHALVEK